MPTSVLELGVDELAMELLTDVFDDVVASASTINRHTGVTVEGGNYTTEFVLESLEKITLPGFDMKTEAQPVGPNGARRGNLLNGREYTVIPINAEHTPGQFHAMTDADRELYMSANMLAEKAGTEAALLFLQGATGGDMSKVYQWVSGRFEGAVGEVGSRTVFRTVSKNSPPASWWYPPRTIYNPVPIEKALAEIESLFGGG